MKDEWDSELTRLSSPDSRRVSPTSNVALRQHVKEDAASCSEKRGLATDTVDS